MKLCCFIGHRNIVSDGSLITKIEKVVDELLQQGVNVFTFGSNSLFEDLCYKQVSKRKNDGTDLKRVLVDKVHLRMKQTDYELLKEKFEEIITLPDLSNAGKYTYVEKNKRIIDSCDVCVFYYDENYCLPSLTNTARKSGTKTAYDYAVKKQKQIINLAR